MERTVTGQQKKDRPLLYLADIRPLYREELMRRVYGCVDGARQAKVDACKTVQAKAASLAAGFLADYALREYEKAAKQPAKAEGISQGSAGHAWCVRYGEKGQPVVCRVADRAYAGTESPVGAMVNPPFISLSHSGDYAVCAIAGAPVGVDIQRQQPIRAGMLRHFFTEEERKEFLQRFAVENKTKKQKEAGGKMPGDKAAEAITAGCTGTDTLGIAAQAAFLRLWTIKESYMKLTGAGMGMGFANICVEPDKKIAWERGHACFPERMRVCRIWEYPAPEGYFLSACTGGVRGGGL